MNKFIKKENQDEIARLVSSDKLDIRSAMNILINAIQISYDKDHFSDFDRYLINKSLTTFKHYADTKQDIIINFK